PRPPPLPYTTLFRSFAVPPVVRADRQGPPRLPGRPWQSRRGRPPRRVRRPLRPLAVTTTAAFRDAKPLGTREHKVFGAAFPTARSEEHTSELQSREN